MAEDFNEMNDRHHRRQDRIRFWKMKVLPLVLGGIVGIGITEGLIKFGKFVVAQQEARNQEVFTVKWPGHPAPVTVIGADSFVYSYGSLSFSDGRTEYQCVQDAEIVRIR